MRSSSERLRPGRGTRPRRSGVQLLAVAATVSIVSAVGLGACSDDEPEAPVPTPVETDGAGTLVDAAPGSTEGLDTDTGAEPTTPGTGLITIDGPATVDSSFSGANPGGG